MSFFFFCRLAVVGCAVLAANVALAQTGESRDALWQRWSRARDKAETKAEAYTAAKEYFQRFDGVDERQARPMRPWVRMYEADLVRAQLPALREQMRSAYAAKEYLKAAEVAAQVLKAEPGNGGAWYAVAVGKDETDYQPAVKAFITKFPDQRTVEAKAARRALAAAADRQVAQWARAVVHAIKPGEEWMRADALGQLHALVDQFHRGSLFAPVNALARARLEQKEGESLADDIFPNPLDPAQGGTEYLRGLAAGQDHDYARALPDIDAAIKKNNAAALDWKAAAYLDGSGVQKSMPVARSLALRAIVQGFGAAGVFLQLIDDPISDNQFPEFDQAVLAARAGDTATAQAAYLKAAEKGSVEAMARVADALKATDPAGAVAWWRRAVARGHVESMRQLGLAYRDGTGVAKDEAQARALLKRAGDQGNWDASAALRKLGGT